MNRDRLVDAIEALEEHGYRMTRGTTNLGFDLNYWARVPSDHCLATDDPDYLPKIAEKALAGENFCGTAACALGLFAVKKLFGLDLVSVLEPQVRFERKDDETVYYNLDAACQAFDISQAQAALLFLPLSFEAKEGPEAIKAVINRIEWLLARGVDAANSSYLIDIYKMARREGRL